MGLILQMYYHLVLNYFDISKYPLSVSRPFVSAAGTVGHVGKVLETNTASKNGSNLLRGFFR